MTTMTLKPSHNPTPRAERDMDEVLKLTTAAREVGVTRQIMWELCHKRVVKAEQPGGPRTMYLIARRSLAVAFPSLYIRANDDGHSGG